MEKLKKEYSKIVDKYLEKFIKKHDLSDFDYWVGGDIGGIAQIGDYYFNFLDIKLDIDLDVEEKTLMEWYDFAVEKNSNVSYSSWVKGYRPIKCWISNCFFDEYLEREWDAKNLGYEPVSLESLKLWSGVDTKQETILCLSELAKCEKLMLPIDWKNNYICRMERDFFLDGESNDGIYNNLDENIIYV